MLDVIYVVGRSARVTDEQLRIAVWACNTQIAREFSIAWGLEPTLVEVAASLDDAPAKPNYAAILVTDDADDPGALGWHTEDDGRIVGRIGVGAVLDAGGVVLLDPSDAWRLSVSAVLSHELLETIRDQTVNAWRDGPPIAQGSQYAEEVCDPVEADQYAITDPNVGAAAVSNFVWPAWFDPDASGQVDQMGTAPGPFRLAPGGYMMVRGGGSDGQAVMGAMGPEGRRPRPWRIGMSKAPGFRSARRVALAKAA